MDYAKKIKRKIKREDKKRAKYNKKSFKKLKHEEKQIKKIKHTITKKFCKDCLKNMYYESLTIYEVDCPENIDLEDIKKILSSDKKYKNIKLSNPYVHRRKLVFSVQ